MDRGNTSSTQSKLRRGIVVGGVLLCLGLMLITVYTSKKTESYFSIVGDETPSQINMETVFNKAAKYLIMWTSKPLTVGKPMENTAKVLGIARTTKQVVSLVQGTIFPTSQYKHSTPAPCPKKRMATVVDEGRLANKIWEYASLWAVGRKLDVEIYIPESMHNALRRMFRNLSIPLFESVKHCDKTYMLLYGNIVLEKYILLVRDVMSFKEEFKSDFVYRKEFVDAATVKFNEVRSKLSREGSDVTFVGVHVRRTDYVKFIRERYNSTPADRGFYLRGMEWFRSRYKNVAFMVTSDDLNWCKRNLRTNQSDVFFVNHSGSDAHIYDLVLLSLCNHSVIDYGTYSLWAAVMADGETIVYDTKNELYFTSMVYNTSGFHFMT